MADEDGIGVAVIRLKRTLVVALLAFLILLQESWGQWILTYPETHLISIAFIVLIGRYPGPKLFETGYTKWLRESMKEKKKEPPPPPSPPNW